MSKILDGIIGPVVKTGRVKKAKTEIVSSEKIAPLVAQPQAPVKQGQTKEPTLSKLTNEAREIEKYIKMIEEHLDINVLKADLKNLFNSKMSAIKDLSDKKKL
jgi:hypothetical protein